jgi:hypothetical protein
MREERLIYEQLGKIIKEWKAQIPLLVRKKRRSKGYKHWTSVWEKREKKRAGIGKVVEFRTSNSNLRPMSVESSLRLLYSVLHHADKTQDKL